MCTPIDVLLRRREGLDYFTIKFTKYYTNISYIVLD